MSLLFSPISFRSVTLRNRIVVSPMCQYSSTDGYATDWHLVHLGSRAVGGAGLVLSEACAVSPVGRISPGDLGIWSDQHIPGLQRITSFLLEQGAVPGIQLAHAGRKASVQPPWLGGHPIPLDQGGWAVVAPSAFPFAAGLPVPKELNHEGIQQVIHDFRSAAVRALEAGFKVAEVHAAHGYLIHEFLSPLSNQRADAYGGSFENRIRLLLEVVRAIREVWPADLPLFVRISVTDWTSGGWDTDQSIRLATLLKGLDTDLIDCSSGGNVATAQIPIAPGYQVPLARAVKEQAGIPTGAVGLITTAAAAEQLLKDGSADLVLLAREYLRNPYFPLQAARDLGHDIDWPVQYARAKQ
ncbi:MAG: dehydrogenase NamA [Bacteroidota bacterium]|jgi:2,4-dienoyl-CoA reductase-like NADH-dependent reductase (Old Yellow Enzyme family)